MKKMINSKDSKYLSHASGMSILALLVISAALLICALPYAHAKVTDVQGGKYEPSKACETQCVLKYSGAFIYPFRENNKRAACTVPVGLGMNCEKCTKMCKLGRSNWAYSGIEDNGQTCVCQYL
eukprot:Nk52_evm55s2192 gene=Nk52_evmTU55s2192